MNNEDYDMDDDGNVPSVLLSIQDFALDEEVQRSVRDFRDAMPSVRAQWQKLCHSNFAPLCLDVLQRMNNGTLDLVLSGKSLVYRGKFTNPPPALLALLSAMTVEQSPGRSAIPSSNTNLVDSMWQIMSSAIKSSTSQHLAPLFGECPLDITTVPLQVLLIFNVIYSHMLLGLDDEAFYDGQWPLRFFNGNNALPTGTMDERDLVRFAVVVTSVKLFSQLYDRDCRHRFMPDGAWLWPLMPTIRKVVDLELMNEDGPHGADATYMLMNGKTPSPYARAALILVTIPQVLSFNERIQLFQKLLDDAKAQTGNTRDEFSRALQVRIQRHVSCSPQVAHQGHIYQRARSSTFFQKRMIISFILTQELSSLWTTHKEALECYRFLGRLLAKAVFENILVEPQFAAFFLNKLLGKFNYIDDLNSLDPELYTSLMRLKHYDGNVEDLALTFSVSEVQLDKVVTRNLLPDGSKVPVTKENRIRYIHLMANDKLNVLTSIECAAFLMGFRDLIPGTWIQMFAPAELQMLIGGTATNIDIDDWERHTQYGGGHHPSQKVIQGFREIVKEDFTHEDRAALLKFITSCSRQPLLGFLKLVPHALHRLLLDARATHASVVASQRS
uniref:HECT-type E3 ubiquitin transferase n=1 Tax=Peronospora matthiolae TaxID=2874970 RepID=A0AAV1UDZ7_9STRA